MQEPQSQVIFNPDGTTVTLVYKDQKEAVKELAYLKLLAGNKGVTKIISYDVKPMYEYIPIKRKWVKEDTKASITVERLYDFTTKLSETHILNIAKQCFDLLKLQFQYNIANSHFFINYKDNTVCYAGHFVRPTSQTFENGNEVVASILMQLNG